MSDKEVEFWRDPKMDEAINDVITIFTEVEGVELVRLSGIWRRFAQISGKLDISPDAVHHIIRRLLEDNVITFDYLIQCPDCGEISYVLKGDFTKPKLCDTCKVMYSLLDGSTLEIIKKEQP